jgi:hypothetical protein
MTPYQNRYEGMKRERPGLSLSYADHAEQLSVFCKAKARHQIEGPQAGRLMSRSITYLFLLILGRAGLAGCLALDATQNGDVSSSTASAAGPAAGLDTRAQSPLDLAYSDGGGDQSAFLKVMQ